MKSGKESDARGESKGDPDGSGVKSKQADASGKTPKEPESPREKKPIGIWGEVRVEPGESRDVYVTIGESYSGATLQIPIHVRRGPEDGPVVFVTAALHGDEINGTGVVRSLIADVSFWPRAGSVLLVPVVNVLAFERHSRYLPDRRDLNRCFPGIRTGSLASRMAWIIFEEIVRRSDYGIDIHTAAVRRTNFPNVRADLSKPGVKRLARAFGSEFIIDALGPKKALRREACRDGCPAILVEGGEVWKVEPTILESTVRGIRNVLVDLGMLDGEVEPPPFQVVLERTKWIRANRAGFLNFHVTPGDVVKEGGPLATNTSLLGGEEEVMSSPFDAAVLGMTTLPAVSAGEPIYHLGRLEKGVRRIERIRAKLPEGSPSERVMDDLSSSLLVVEPEPEGPAEG
jgi:predicted deacylase